jgi:radical SAM superfamily enzyme YgiQ (UPF0313 family)
VELDVKILFVATKKNRDSSERELYELDFMIDVLGYERSLVDLGILTAAAATPADVDIEIIDEYVDAIPYDTDADLIALSAKTSCAPHAYDVADEFRKRGKKVVLGGIHASLRTEEALTHVDYVVEGEADVTWPKFVRMFAEGKAPRVMDEEGFPPMESIPIPRWDRVPHSSFMFHQMQTTRGCPFMCRFCSVPDISGNSFRFKPIENVLKEIAAFPNPGPLKKLSKSMYVVDDNFLSRVQYTKELLRAMIPLRKEKRVPDFSAETTFNVALDEELLDLLRDAGCTTLIIGFESISESTLLSMDKKVNFCLPYAEGLRRIQSRGIAVMANFIVGFDTDTLAVFEDTLKFVDENLITYPFFSILTPMPGTKLHDEYRDAGRLDHFDWSRYDTRHVVMEPKHMTREQLMDGYCYLYEQAYFSDRALARLEKSWATYPHHVSTGVERAFLSLRLWQTKSAARGTAEFGSWLKRAWSRAGAKSVRADLGQLLYCFDSAHFADFLKRYRSASYAANVALFRDPPKVDVVETVPQKNAPPELVQLTKKQWESTRSQRRVG